MSNGKWYDKRKKPDFEKRAPQEPNSEGASQGNYLQSVGRFAKTEPALGETVATWELKLKDVQSFSASGIKSGCDGGSMEGQHALSVMSIMSELGQFAKEMSKKDLTLKPNLARKRIGAMIVHCAELCILHGITLDAAVVDRVNELCDLDKRYDRPSSLL